VIYYITLRALAHATEDVFRVKQALKFFVSSTSVRDRELIEELQSEGHHGNPITILSLQIKRTADCLCFASFVREHFLKEDLARLREEMPERLGNDQVFHLRFDKQAAYLQKVKLTDSSNAITVKVKIKTYPKSREKAGAIVEEFFG
jgi:RNA binding exosome subunit